jgi:hypothetical protein
VPHQNVVDFRGVDSLERQVKVFHDLVHVVPIRITIIQLMIMGHGWMAGNRPAIIQNGPPAQVYINNRGNWKSTDY